MRLRRHDAGLGSCESLDGQAGSSISGSRVLRDARGPIRLWLMRTASPGRLITESDEILAALERTFGYLGRSIIDPQARPGSFPDWRGARGVRRDAVSVSPLRWPLPSAPRIPFEACATACALAPLHSRRSCRCGASLTHAHTHTHTHTHTTTHAAGRVAPAPRARALPSMVRVAVLPARR